MKELYSFVADRTIIKEEPFIKKGKNGPIESVKKVKVPRKNKIIIKKPSIADIEKAEFFFGQKYNEFINKGFLTKAMLAKKMGEISASNLDQEVSKAFTENLEASRIIEFYSGADNLEDEQKNALTEANKKFIETQIKLVNYENIIRDQFSQTAEVKAENKMIEWFVFNFAYYEDEVDGEKRIFPMFSGSTFDEKRDLYLSLCEDVEDIDDESVLKIKGIFDASFIKISQVINIWYNKLAKNHEEIDKKLKEIFPEDKPEGDNDSDE